MNFWFGVSLFFEAFCFVTLHRASFGLAADQEMAFIIYNYVCLNSNMIARFGQKRYGSLVASTLEIKTMFELFTFIFKQLH